MKVKLAIIFLLIVLIGFSAAVAEPLVPTTAKGMWIWMIWNVEGGDLTAIINRLKNSGVTWVVIKIGDSDSYYNRPGKSLYNWAANYGGMENVVKIFHQNGIKLFGFQYVYGEPHWNVGVTEADVANMILDIPGLDGLLVDAEIEFDTLQNRSVIAASYMDSIRAHHLQSFVGLTSWARVSGHNTFPWVAFLKRSDVNMPQAYWAARKLTPQQEVNRMQSEFGSWYPIWAVATPIVPIGQGGYFGYGNPIYPGDISSFCNVAQGYHYQGVSLWAYHVMTSDTWNEYAAVSWTPSYVEQESSPVPYGYSLLQNYPNPFSVRGGSVYGGSPTTTIEFSIRSQAKVSLRVYDMLGQEVATLVDKELSPGFYKSQFDGSNLPSGVYLIRLIAGNYSESRRMVLIR